MYLSVLNYFVENYHLLFELIGLVMILELSVHISKRNKRLALIAVALLIIESVIFYLEVWTQTFETLSIFRPMLTTALYSIYPLMLMVITELNVPRKLPNYARLLIAAPWLVSIPIYFTSQWTHLVHWYLDDNIYHGGPLYWWPYMIFGFYGAVFLVRTFLYFKNYSKLNRYFTAYIVVAPFIGVMLYIFAENEYDYNTLFSSALLLYLFCTYIHLAKVDPLTSLMNRQSYYQDIRANEKLITAIVSVDMNDLKLINDRQGHEAGDRALKTVAEILRDNSGDRGTVYRMGGDEFIIIYTDTDQHVLEWHVDRMRQRMEETPYSCAFGYTVKSPDEPIKEAIIRADAMMYDNKAKIKSTPVRTCAGDDTLSDNGRY